MSKERLSELKEEIEVVRDELNVCMVYPDIFEDEIKVHSDNINELINEYIKVERDL